MNNVLVELDELDRQVQDGEITGIIEWPLTGTCTVEEISLTSKNGSQYFSLKLFGDKGKRIFLVRIPNKQDSESAKFMGMKKIYNTVYALGSKIGGVSPQGAYIFAKTQCGKNKFKYALSTYNSPGRNGNVFVNQSLESLEIIDDSREFL